jgi:hypothetical protein
MFRRRSFETEAEVVADWPNDPDHAVRQRQDPRPSPSEKTIHVKIRNFNCRT